jgi:hypothetical protein
MSTDIYKLKYIKYKKKYSELKSLKENILNIEDKIIILPKEYNLLNQEIKKKFEIYERDTNLIPISYIKTQYLNKIGLGGDNLDTTTSSNKEEDYILEKKIITPDEYFILSDKNKSKYSINESDYEKFPNRVVPKNYKKID